MYQNYKKSLRDPAVILRKRGLSFSEIRRQLPVAKSTLSYWLKDVKLTREQLANLEQKQKEARVRGTKKKILQTKRAVEDIRRSSLKAVQTISKRELWLMGIMLYWRERFLNKNEEDMRKGVRFSSSDPYLIKFFLKWLQDVGRLKKEEIDFDLFISSAKKNKLEGIIHKWSTITGFPKKSFKHVYYLKTSTKSLSSNKANVDKRKPYKKSPIGLLRIRVKASSMLARQLSGWIHGIQRFYWYEDK